MHDEDKRIIIPGVSEFEANDPKNSDSYLTLKARLLGSPLLFTQTFFQLRTGKEFNVIAPPSRESRFITTFRVLKRVFNGELKRVIISCPPRYGKTELIINFMAWGLAHYPDSNFTYVSYSKPLAKSYTAILKNIIELPEYRYLFDTYVLPDSSAKHDFLIAGGGSVYATGAEGTLTGKGAGISDCVRFGGALIIDDILKTEEAESDTIREDRNTWFFRTAQSRLNDPINTPIIIIAQRLHEHDLIGYLTEVEKDKWTVINIPALDMHNNPLDPTKHTLEMLLEMKETMPYYFSAQYQGEPIPAGGGLFKREWFVLKDQEPELLATFITCDTAETDKNYSDYSVFSFWGLYKVNVLGAASDQYALHWIDCHEFKAEPVDMHREFMNFYMSALRFKVKPSFVAIEKKSTGTTLISILKEMQGIEVIDINRTIEEGNKSSRFRSIQQYIGKRLISLPRLGRHTERCLNHCEKITANNSHRHDDIADTLYDAIKIGLIDDFVRARIGEEIETSKVASDIVSNFNYLENMRRSAW